MTMVSCCVHRWSTDNHGIPATLNSFSSYLGEYGIESDLGELTKGYTGKELRKMGLLIDNPDGGGGSLIRDPFTI